MLTTVTLGHQDPDQLPSSISWAERQTQGEMSDGDAQPGSALLPRVAPSTLQGWLGAQGWAQEGQGAGAEGGSPEEPLSCLPRRASSEFW